VHVQTPKFLARARANPDPKLHLAVRRNASFGRFEAVLPCVLVLVSALERSWPAPNRLQLAGSRNRRRAGLADAERAMSSRLLKNDFSARIAYYFLFAGSSCDNCVMDTGRSGVKCCCAAQGNDPVDCPDRVGGMRFLGNIVRRRTATVV
jgi:hypothetical protein